jgi:hypothetical protein
MDNAPAGHARGRRTGRKDSSFPEQLSRGDETAVHKAGVQEWFQRSGTTSERHGVMMVHADAEGDPYRGRIEMPTWMSDSDLQRRGLNKNSAAYRKRLALEQWVRRVHANALHYNGLGVLVDDPDGSDIKQFFRKLPTKLKDQRYVMQNMRAEGNPRITNRYMHQADCAYIGGMIAVQSGLPREVVEEATLASLIHDIGHDAFAHSFEAAAENLLRETDPSHAPANWNHAENSGAVLASFNWDPNNETHLSEVIYAVSNHSWSMRHGRHSDPLMTHAGLLADLTGAADRISYSITDLLDALEVGRLRWEDVPVIIPQALELAQFTKREIQELVDMGLGAGAPLLQERLRNAFIRECATVFRETGLIGFRYQAASALNEMRSTSKHHLFGLPDREHVEEQMYVLCGEVLREMRRDAMREGFPEETASHEAIRRYGRLTEPQVIVYAQRHRLNLAVQRKVNVNGESRVQTIPFHPKSVMELPTTPATVTEGRVREKDFAARVLPIHRIVSPNFSVRADNGSAVPLNAAEAMHLLTLLNAQGNKPIEMTIWSAPGEPRFTLPVERGLRQQLGERAKAALEDAVTEAVQRYDDLSATMFEGKPSPSMMGEPRSLGALVRLFRESDGDLASTLHRYVERSFEYRSRLPQDISMPDVSMPAEPGLELSISA